jgi:hypothetical protein
MLFRPTENNGLGAKTSLHSPDPSVPKIIFKFSAPIAAIQTFSKLRSHSSLRTKPLVQILNLISLLYKTTTHLALLYIFHLPEDLQFVQPTFFQKDELAEQ